MRLQTSFFSTHLVFVIHFGTFEWYCWCVKTQQSRLQFEREKAKNVESLINQCTLTVKDSVLFY